MFTAFLASLHRLATHLWWHYQHSTVDQYYERVTRVSLQSRLRWELLDGDYNAFVPELRNAIWKQNVLRQLFEEFAVNDDTTGRRVWTQKGFIAFIASRFDKDHEDLTLCLARTLWRSFCFSATYPFADQSADPELQTVDLDGWTQALAFLATDAARNVGRNRSVLMLYGTGRRSAWLRYVSSLTLSGQRKSAIVMGASVDGDDWRPPNMLDEIAYVAACQLPLPMYRTLPPDTEIRSRVERLAGISSETRNPITDFGMPYQDLLALLFAIMHVEKGEWNNDWTREQYKPTLSLGGDSDAKLASAKAIIQCGGVSENTPVTFASYLNFSQKFRSTHLGWQWSFDQELEFLWRALFFSHSSSLPMSHTLPQHPPSVITQTLDFLYPIKQDRFERERRRQSALLYFTETEPNGSRDKVLNAMTWPYGGKITVIYGTTTSIAALAPIDVLSSSPSLIGQSSRPMDSNEKRERSKGRPATFAIMTSSPLWCVYKTGAISDFLTGDEHFLMELAPRPRALWHASECTKFVDLVNAAVEGSLSFGRVTDGANSSVFTSGLTVDFKAGVATLSSQPFKIEGFEPGYKEVKVGHSCGPLEQLDNAESWETAMRVRKIEVYGLPAGVAEDLEIARLGTSAPVSDQ